jgi:RNA polymerase sigma-70 factor (ECF subfamily)
MSVAPLHRYERSETEFDDVFRRYYTRVRGLARRQFPGLDAEEIAQEAMLRLLTHLDRLDPRRDPWPYIATTTVNVGRDMIRAARPTVELDECAEDVSVAAAADDELLHSELDDRLTDALQQVPPAGRQVLALHAYDDMSVGQIAAFLGINDNAVRQKLFRARRQFVRAFEQLAAATAAVVGGFAWARRTRVSRSGSAVVQASAMTLSSAALIVAGVAGMSHYAPDVTVDRTTAHAAAMSQREPATAAPAGRIDHAGVRTLQASSRSARVPVVATAPVEARVEQPQQLFHRGQTNAAHVAVRTPLGTLHLDSHGHNDGDSMLCDLPTAAVGCG